MSHSKSFVTIAVVVPTLMTAGSLWATAVEDEVAELIPANEITLLSNGIKVTSAPGRIPPAPMSPPIEAAPRVVHGIQAAPLGGWPISNGSGMEAGFNGSPTFADLDRDGDLEILVGSRDAKVYAWHHDGTTVTGWPFTTGSYVVSGVAVGDINDDQYPEVVFNSNDGYLYAVSHGGVVMSGWPKLLETQYPHSGGAVLQSSPVLADLDGDNSMDIIFSSNKHHVTYAFNSQGQDLPGWPKAWDGEEFNAKEPAVGDLDGDGSVEIVVGTMYTSDGGEDNYNKIYAWHSDGSPVTGWPVILEDYWWSPIWAVALADIDGDRALDVLATDILKVYVLHADGTMHIGWPYASATSDLGPSRIAIANLDDDEQLEVVADFLDDMLILDDDGTLMSSYPIPQADPNDPVIADVDNDGLNEIISAGDYPYDSVYAWNEDGSLVDGFPLVTEGWVDGTPLIVDIDGDGDLEIAVGDCDPNATAVYFYVWDLAHPENPSMKEWPMFQHDQQNTGRYTAPLVFADGFETGNTFAWSVTVP